MAPPSAEAALKSGDPSRPQHYVPRGVAARCIDHLTVNTSDIRADSEWYRDTLGHRWMEYSTADEDASRILFATTTTGERDYLYCREPSGLRVELNAGGYRNQEPDWKTVGWTVSQGGLSFYKNITMPHSMFESFPAPAHVDAHDIARTREEMTMFIS